MSNPTGDALLAAEETRREIERITGIQRKPLGGARIMGCDPGASGALFLLSPNGNQCADMPTFEVAGKRSVDYAGLSELLADWRPTKAIVESVHAMPKQGVSSSFNFGMAFGALLQALASAQIPYTLVTPQQWTKTMGVNAKEKDSGRQVASRLMPADVTHWPLMKHHGRAEAALIAMYGAK